MDIKSLTAKKVGGIPVVWIILGVGVVALYGALKLKPAPADTTATDAADTPDLTGDVDTSQPVFSATPTITQPSGVNTGSVTAVSGPDTDELWKRRAIAYLIPSYGLTVATSAITKYLNSEVLTAQEGQARDAAVAQFGIPPESVPGTATTPASPTNIPTTPPYSGPASKQGTPPTVHTVKGTSDNTWEELARLYYGSTSGDVLRLLHAYNTSLPSSWTVGTRVTIPKLTEPKYYRANSAHRNKYDIARVNGTTPAIIEGLNPGKKFPVKVGTRVRVR
jgi:hypothetical protein